MQLQGQRPPIVDAFGPPAQFVSPAMRTVNWGAAVLYGLGAAFLGGVVWGFVAAVAGYIFVWGAILIGLFVGWAMQKGAGKVTIGVIAVAALLTLLAVFIGDVVALSILGASFGLSPADIIVNYPEILAFAPGEAALTYGFGAVGVAAAMYTLWGKMKSQRRPRLWTPYMIPPGVPSGAVPATTPAVTDPPVVENISHGGTAGVRVRTKTSPERILEATYQTMTGAAVVTLDGQPFTKVRVWGAEETVTVPLGGSPPQVVSLRFYGVRPRIDVRVNGALVSSV